MNRLNIPSALAALALGALALSVFGTAVYAGAQLLTPGHRRTQFPSTAAEQIETAEPAEFAAAEPYEPPILHIQGLTIEDDPHVWSLLDMAMPCSTWMGGSSDQRASVMDLLRLRRMGYASLPADYRIEHENQEGSDYVVVYERMRQRDGSDVRGMPGFVQHRYLYDEARQRFEYLGSEAREAGYRPDLLRALGDPLSFLAQHWVAVCNGRLRLPEVRADLQARRGENGVDTEGHADAIEAQVEGVDITPEEPEMIDHTPPNP